VLADGARHIPKTVGGYSTAGLAFDEMKERSMKYSIRAKSKCL
jgi:hypothetical protein